MTNGDDTKRITLPPKSDIDRGVMTAKVTLDSAYSKDDTNTIELGYGRLWGWFGLERSSFLKWLINYRRPDREIIESLKWKKVKQDV